MLAGSAISFARAAFTLTLMYCNVGLKTSGNQLKNNKSDSFCNNTVSNASREKVLYGIC